MVQRSLDNQIGKSFWHVIFVRQHYERRISEKLTKMGIENILPQTKVMREYKSQRRRVLVPLFPGYLFLKVVPGKRHHVTFLNGVYRFLRVGDEYEQVSETEIDNLKILARDASHQITKEDYLKKGTGVEVIDGPLYGISGFVSGCNGGRILVTVNAIRTSISISVPKKYLKVKEREMALAVR
ncbi:transcription termination/antitermination NusG family protein [Fulvivirga sp.]|uniref:transcription termination/antitermination NusG family protein n=1 Tax=Fulvivirga sp. TaxID=1931237 RepID=UPI0032EAB0F8